MKIILASFQTLLEYLQAENLHRVILAVLLLLLMGGAGFSLAEKLGFWDSLWWAVVTMTTVGYGDISPGSLAGKIIGVFLMLSGIGFLGILTATIASAFVDNKMLENKGMKAIKEDGHFVVYGWNRRGEAIVRELLADAKLEGVKIVIIADLPEKPVPQKQVLFYRGRMDDDTMENTRLAQAGTIVLLADDNIDPEYCDARMVMDVMSVRSRCPDIYICVELADSQVLKHVKDAGANEVITAGDIRSNLLVQAALDHGISEVVTELVSNSFGNELYKFPVPDLYVGRTFHEALCGLKEKKNVICLGVHQQGRKVMTNPPAEMVLAAGDFLLGIADDRALLK